MKNLFSNESGQDIVEYALVVCVIAFGAIAAMGALATEINLVFNTITSNLASSL